MSLDLVIRGAEVWDGERPGRRADVGVRGGAIATVAAEITSPAAEVIDAQGAMLCPGFIDLHAHSALRTFDDPLLEPKLAQGFTTELIHPDGLAPAPVAPERREPRRAYLRSLEGPGPTTWTWTGLSEYVAALAATGPATTLVPSVGHNAVRDAVMGSGRRAPDQAELAAMREVVREGLEMGARSLSFGLIYLPGMYAGPEELEALGREAARFQAPLVPHVRNEADGVVDAVREMIGVARRAGAPLHISHLKVVGDPRLLDPLLALIDDARRSHDVTFDQYPYGAGSTMLTALLPQWAQEGGAEAILARLTDRDARRTMAEDVRSGVEGWENLYRACGPERILIADAADPRRGDVGRDLATIGEERRQDPFEAALDLLADTRLAATMVDHYASEETVRAIFRHPAALVGSDGIFGARPHPRLHGTAARVLGRLALRDRVVDVGDAVARLTARPADRIGLRDRGRIREGLRADLVLLDPGEFVDEATYEDPCRRPPGVRAVLVAGRRAFERGRATGARAGGVVGAAGDGR